jgi:uncharacterized protein
VIFFKMGDFCDFSGNNAYFCGMIINFKVSNFLSFNQEALFSMSASQEALHPQHVLKGKSRNDVDVLRTAVIYGANASGKSNFIKAIDVARSMIVHPTNIGKGLPFMPFRLDSKQSKRTTRFEFDIRIGDELYNYGFEYDKNKIHKEWLVLLLKTTEKPVFERTSSSKEAIGIDFNAKLSMFSAKEKELFDLLKIATRPEQLLLRKLAENNVSFFKKIYDWFDDQLVILFPESRFDFLEIQLKKNANFREQFSDFLHAFDTGISRIELKEIKMDQIQDIPLEILNQISQDIEKGSFASVRSNSGLRYVFEMSKGVVRIFKLNTVHKAFDGSEIHFELTDESDGTQRIMDFIPMLMALTKGSVFIIDEFDRSLHPKIMSQFWEYVHEQKEFMAGQLIATSHDITQLSTDHFRRDEMWLAEKTEFGETRLFSIAEFKLRHDKDIRKEYMAGRLGGVPFLSSRIKTRLN